MDQSDKTPVQGSLSDRNTVMPSKFKVASSIMMGKLCKQKHDSDERSAELDTGRKSTSLSGDLKSIPEKKEEPAITAREQEELDIQRK